MLGVHSAPGSTPLKIVMIGLLPYSIIVGWPPFLLALGPLRATYIPVYDLTLHA